MIQDNSIIIYQLNIIIKLLKYFQEEIKDLMFKGLTMLHLTEFHSTPEYSNKILSTNKKLRYQ